MLPPNLSTTNTYATNIIGNPMTLEPSSGILSRLLIINFPNQNGRLLPSSITIGFRCKQATTYTVHLNNNIVLHAEATRRQPTIFFSARNQIDSITGPNFMKIFKSYFYTIPYLTNSKNYVTRVSRSAARMYSQFPNIYDRIHS